MSKQMEKAVSGALHVVRSSEFWVVLGQAIIEATHSDIPAEFKEIGWAYIVLRVLSKVAKYIFPHPAKIYGR